MNERLMELRKKMNLSRQAFGEMLGVSGDVINNLERGRVEMKDYMVMLIAEKFNVSENWLRTGEGEMYKESPEDAILALSKKYKLSPFQEALIRGIVELDSKQIDALWDTFRKYLSPFIENEKPTDQEPTDGSKEIESTKEEKLAAYSEFIDLQEKGETSSGSAS